jgi:hypothetical protein
MFISLPLTKTCTKLHQTFDCFATKKPKIRITSVTLIDLPDTLSLSDLF